MSQPERKDRRITEMTARKRLFEDDTQIEFTVNNISRLPPNGVTSPPQNIGGFPWAIRVTPTPSRTPSISIVCLKSNECRVWYCNANISVTSRNAYFRSYLTLGKVHHRFSVNNPTFTCPVNREYDLPVYPVLDPRTARDFINVSARIECVGGNEIQFRKKVDLDFLSPNEMFDCVLNLETEKIYVNKHFLASRSPFFKTLFYGGFEESTKSEIDVKDVHPDEFVMLLELIYKTEKVSINADNAECLLMLMDRFQIEGLLDDIELALIPDSSMEVVWKLRLAEQYGMHTLKEAAIEGLQTVKEIRAVRKSIDFDYLTHETERALFDRLLALNENK